MSPRAMNIVLAQHKLNISWLRYFCADPAAKVEPYVGLHYYRYRVTISQISRHLAVPGHIAFPSSVLLVGDQQLH